MAATLIDFYLYIQWAFKWYIRVKPNIDLSNPIYQHKCPVKHYCHIDSLGRHHLTLSHDLITWPQVTLDMSITPDLCRWQSFTERCNDSVTDKTKQSKWLLWGEHPMVWQLAPCGCTYISQVWESDQRASAFTNTNNQLHISKILKIQMLLHVVLTS